MEGRTVRPAADRQQHLQVTMLLLQLVYGLEVAVQVLALVVPGIGRVVDLLVRPCVREEDLSCVGLQIGEGIEDVPGCALATGESDAS